MYAHDLLLLGFWHRSHSRFYHDELDVLEHLNAVVCTFVTDPTKRCDNETVQVIQLQHQFTVTIEL